MTTTTTRTYRKYWTDSKRFLVVAFVLGAVTERSLGLGGGACLPLLLGQQFSDNICCGILSLGATAGKGLDGSVSLCAAVGRKIK